MKFYDPYTCYDATIRRAKADSIDKASIKELTVAKAYAAMWKLFEDDEQAGRVTKHEMYSSLNQFIAESKWYDDGRPYYLVYPGLVPLFDRIKLDAIPIDIVDSKMRELGGTTVMMRFAEGTTDDILTLDGTSLRTILLTFSEMDGHRVASMHSWFGWTAQDTMLPLGAYTHLPIGCSRTSDIDSVLTVDDAMVDIPLQPEDEQVGEHWTTDKARVIARIVVGVLLLADDMITPDVLRRDEHKPLTDRIIERARQRGKNGWHIGREIETIPHWRRPHLAWIRYGKGRKERRLQMRAGSVVHRDKVKDIPTAWGDDDASTDH